MIKPFKPYQIIIDVAKEDDEEELKNMCAIEPDPSELVYSIINQIPKR